MNALDNAIDTGVRKHRLFAVISASALVLVLAFYLFWLFLLQGFTLVVSPTEAREQAEFKRLSGVGFMLGNKLYLLSDNARIEVSAHLYLPEVVAIDANTASTIEVTLEPQPARLAAQVKPTLAQPGLVAPELVAPALNDAVWRIDGVIFGEGAEFQAELPEGEFNLTVSHPFYESQTAIISARKGEEINQEFILEPVLGKLTLNSLPAGAEITLDGEVAGTTPLELALVGGRYEVQIQAQGYEPISDTIRLSVGTPEASRNYQLELLKATLHADLQPSGGVLTVNAQPVGNPARVNANRALLVRYSKAGYRPATQELELAPGAEARTTFNLQPQLGEVSITANVPAEVAVNGVAQGQVPLDLELQTVPQRVRFEYPGYRALELEVQPSATAARSVNAELITEFDARRAEGRPLFANTIGINLLPVSLQPFTMGSPPSENGRSRDELQREVSFSRNIWLSEHEITEGQFARFTGQGDTSSELPVTNISWLDAARFTNWLSEQEGLLPFYQISGNRLVGVHKDSRGYRLPTEAEWEFVAKHFRRAARTQYIWGNQSVLRDNQANFADEALRGEQTYVLRDYEDEHKGKAPVGSYPADRNGFYDLAGNVREWVHDSYQLLPVTNNNTAPAAEDYLGPERGNGHVVKGASYLTGQMQLLRASARAQETEAAADIGFRIARYHN
ncbi:hypothetical protein CWE08_07030 [Aliidiomarina iranensis]|uniref:PEGA domain-containing protein n=1 Tax=Aliidiomarina iranensis TaxID=1434071 RepID=A0A432VWA4_9GAMM|nr:SUMF1/EgtB/PvdO family nonheme iron enzyme [Aliidiomarina iranensis]RUO20848.1 hypothetical protein CWE08_07030 [Aliidiomarina iranensis]